METREANTGRTVRTPKPRPFKPETVGNPERPNQSLGVDVLEWYHLNMIHRQEENWGRVGHLPDDAAQQIAAYYALKHLVESGLVVPLRSSIVRNILAGGEAAANVLAWGPVIYAEVQAVITEADARKAGQCTTFSWGN
jgi:hypothetical protein